ncbi:hypothetical protein Q9233_004536, partial [Columba guinea]
FVRLVDGKSRCSGRVEIRDGNQWKTVCGSRFGPKAADMVCRELQCGVALPVSGGGRRPEMPPEPLAPCPNSSSCTGLVLFFYVLARADPTRGRPTVSGRISVPVIICIILGALLCLLLALLAGQALRARAGRRGGSFHRAPNDAFWKG